jgi:hypothetical protein
MERLLAELQRLFSLPTAAGENGNAFPGAGLRETPEMALPEAGLSLQARLPDGSQRVWCIALARPTDWEYAAAICRGVQEDLDLPAPMVSVDGQGFRLWFSLAMPISQAQGQGFLAGILSRYTADLPAGRLQADTATSFVLPPARLADSERWTAFIDPSMGSMFIDEQWLDMAPNLDKQADLLSAFRAIKPAEFERALAQLAPTTRQLSPAADIQRPETAPGKLQTLAFADHYSDPKSFLLAVMNDPAASAGDRIEAAKALLPYFEKMV